MLDPAAADPDAGADAAVGARFSRLTSPDGGHRFNRFMKLMATIHGGNEKHIPVEAVAHGMRGIPRVTGSCFFSSLPAPLFSTRERERKR